MNNAHDVHFRATNYFARNILEMDQRVLLGIVIVIIIIAICAYHNREQSTEGFRASWCDCERYNRAMNGAYDASLKPCKRQYLGFSPFDEAPCYYPELNPFWAPYGTTVPYTEDANGTLDVPVARMVSDMVPLN